MLRRLCAFLLVLACAFAPALPAIAALASPDDCCCERSCCATTDCALPPATARTTTTTLTVVGAVEARAAVARPAARTIAIRLLTLASLLEKISARAARVSLARPVIEVAASAPLYRVHCTFLI